MMEARKAGPVSGAGLHSHRQVRNCQGYCIVLSAGAIMLPASSSQYCVPSSRVAMW